MHLGGRRCALPPTPLQLCVLSCLLSQLNTFKGQHSKQKRKMQRTPKAGCLLSQPNTFQEQHSKQKRKNKTTSAKDFFVSKLPPLTARYLPSTTFQTKTQDDGLSSQQGLKSVDRIWQKGPGTGNENVGTEKRTGSEKGSVGPAQGIPGKKKEEG